MTNRSKQNHHITTAPNTLRKKIALSFSGGKDSIFALYNLLNNKKYVVDSLLTTIDQDNKVLMHGVDHQLILAQAESIGIKLHTITIPPTNNGNSTYEEQIKNHLVTLKKQGIEHFAYGDLHLEDIKKFRENKLASIGVHGLFPLWGKKPKKIAKDFIKLGFQAIITCVNTKLIPHNWVGKKFDQDFVSFLLKNKLDPCGENGEFHTFVYAGPIFKHAIKYYLDFTHPIICNEFYACSVQKLQSS